jgi:uncharacterized membrane protein
VLVLSTAIIAVLWLVGLDFILFPALAGFLVFAPALATGSTRKVARSRTANRWCPGHAVSRPARADRSVHRRAAVRADAVWMRAAIIIYAVLRRDPFPEGRPRATMLLTTQRGAAMLSSAAGSGVVRRSAGDLGLFDPDDVRSEVDALTAMANSWALVWNNRQAMIV